VVCERRTTPQVVDVAIKKHKFNQGMDKQEHQNIRHGTACVSDATTPTMLDITIMEGVA
jgi:hypothetical protein